MKIRPADSTQWYADNGDNTFRLDYKLNSKSIVVDIGARHGNWSDQIRRLYGCEVHCFEVVDEFCNELRSKGHRVYRKAVYNHTGIIKIGVSEDEGSIYHTDDLFEVECIKASDIFSLTNSSTVDLMKINIEGAEYAVLTDLINSESITRVRELQVQFHELEGAEEAYTGLVTRLARTHKLTWRYPFVWENWKLITP